MSYQYKEEFIDEVLNLMVTNWDDDEKFVQTFITAKGCIKRFMFTMYVNKCFIVSSY